MSSTDNGANDGITKFPKLIVLDLDNTVWTPELYQLRKLQRANQTPVAGHDVKLFKVDLAELWMTFDAADAIFSYCNFRFG